MLRGRVRAKRPSKKGARMFGCGANRRPRGLRYVLAVVGDDLWAVFGGLADKFDEAGFAVLD